MSLLLWVGGAAAAAYVLMGSKKKSEAKGPGAGVYQMTIRYNQPLTEKQLQMIRDEYTKFLDDTDSGSLINVQQVGNEVRIDVAFNQTPPISPTVQPFKLGDTEGTLVSMNKIA